MSERGGYIWRHGYLVKESGQKYWHLWIEVNWQSESVVHWKWNYGFMSDNKGEGFFLPVLGSPSTKYFPYQGQFWAPHLWNTFLIKAHLVLTLTSFGCHFKAWLFPQAFESRLLLWCSLLFLCYFFWRGEGIVALLLSLTVVLNYVCQLLEMFWTRQQINQINIHFIYFIFCLSPHCRTQDISQHKS